jgi:hypothetical protein
LFLQLRLPGGRLLALALVLVSGRLRIFGRLG